MKIQAFSLYLCRKILKNILMEQLCRLLFISFLFVSACVGGGSPSHRLLERADSLLDVRPDSALRLLQEVSPRQLADRGGRMHYALLLMQAKYKNYLPVSEDDTLARELAAYYADAGDAGMQARAYYNLGCVYEDRQEPDLALKAYHEAGRQARRAGDTRTLCRTYNNLAYICLNQGMPGRADSLYAEVEQLARQAGDSVRLAEALLRRGAYQLSLGKEAYPRAEQLIWQGYGLAQNLHSPVILHLAYSFLYALHSYQHQDREALQIAKAFMAMPLDVVSQGKACLLVGSAYSRVAQYDSAAVYLKEALETDDFWVREEACVLLSHMAEQRGDTGQALRWQKEKDRNRLEQQELQRVVKLAVAAREVELEEAMRLQDDAPPSIYYYVLFFAGGLFLWVWLRRIIFHRRATLACPVSLDHVPEGLPEWDFNAFRQDFHQTASFAIMGSIWEYYNQSAAYVRHWGSADTLKFLREAEAWLPGYRAALQHAYPSLNAKDVFLCLLYLAGLNDSQIGILIERDKSSVIRRRQHMLKQKMGQEQTKIDNLLEICMLIPKTAPNAPISDAERSQNAPKMHLSLSEIRAKFAALFRRQNK